MTISPETLKAVAEAISARKDQSLYSHKGFSQAAITAFLQGSEMRELLSELEMWRSKDRKYRIMNLNKQEYDAAVAAISPFVEETK